MARPRRGEVVRAARVDPSERSPDLDHFVPLLVLTSVTIATLSLVDVRSTDDDPWRDVVAGGVGVLTGVTLLVALRAAGVRRRWRRIAAIVFAVGVASTAVQVGVELISDDGSGARSFIAGSPIWVLIACVTPVAVVLRVVRHRIVTFQTIVGALTGYLLIGLAFCNATLFLSAAIDGQYFVGASEDNTTAFMYFNLVTLTTVGYGDVVAATEFGRLLATSEAVLGQIYLVTFVALLVGLFARQPRDVPAD